MSQFQKRSVVAAIACAIALTVVSCVPNEPIKISANTAATDKLREEEKAEAAKTAAAAVAAAAASQKDGQKNSQKDGKWGRAPASIKGGSRHGAKSAANSLFVVQIGAFKVRENAEKLTKKLKDDGFPVRMQSMNHSRNGELHLVRFEPSPNRAEAQEVMEKLKEKESLTGQLLTLPAGT